MLRNHLRAIFVYSPAILMRSSVINIVIVTVASLAGIWFICAAMTGYFTRILPFHKRAFFTVAGVMLLLPFEAAAINGWLNIAGAALGVALVVMELKLGRTHVRA